MIGGAGLLSFRVAVALTMAGRLSAVIRPEGDDDDRFLVDTRWLLRGADLVGSAEVTAQSQERYAPPPRQATGRPATDRQTDYIESLLEVLLDTVSLPQGRIPTEASNVPTRGRVRKRRPVDE